MPQLYSFFFFFVLGGSLGIVCPSLNLTKSGLVLEEPIFFLSLCPEVFKVVYLLPNQQSQADCLYLCVTWRSSHMPSVEALTHEPIFILMRHTHTYEGACYQGTMQSAGGVYELAVGVPRWVSLINFVYEVLGRVCKSVNRTCTVCWDPCTAGSEPWPLFSPPSCLQTIQLCWSS